MMTNSMTMEEFNTLKTNLKWNRGDNFPRDLSLPHRFHVRSKGTYVNEWDDNDKAIHKHTIGYFSTRSIQLEELLNNNRVAAIDEIFSKNRATRLAFDIDGVAENCIDILLTTLRNAVMDVFDDLELDVYPKFMVYERDKGDKGWSLHVHELNVVFSPNGGDIFKDIIRPIVEIVNKKVSNICPIDMAIYYHNKSLRTPWKNKIYDNSEGNEFSVRGDSVDMNDPYYYLVHFPLFRVKDYPGCREIKVWKIDFIEKMKSIYNDAFPMRKYCIENLLSVADYDSDDEGVALTGNEIDLLNGYTGIEWCIVGHQSCTQIGVKPINIDRKKYRCPCYTGDDKEIIHTSNNWRINVLPDGAVVLACYSDCGTIVLKKGDGSYVDMRAINTIETITKLSDTVHINQKYLSDTGDNNRCRDLDISRVLRKRNVHLGIQSATGTGKSTFAIELIKAAVHGGRKVLFIAPLRTLTDMLHSKIMTALGVLKEKEKLPVNIVDSPSENPEDYFIGYYRVFDDSHNECTVFVCTPESLATKAGNEYDIVIYDEITTIISNLAGMTMKNRVNSFIVKNERIQEKVKLSIMIDAHLLSMSDELVHGKKILHYTNNYVPIIGDGAVVEMEKQFMTFIDNEGVERNASIQLSKMVLMMRNGVPFAYCSNSRTNVINTECFLEEQAIIIDEENLANGIATMIAMLSIYRPPKTPELEEKFVHLGCIESEKIYLNSIGLGDSDEALAYAREIMSLKTSIFESDDWKDYSKAEKDYCEKIRLVVKNRDNNEWWSQFDVVLYSPSIMVGLDFNCTHFKVIFSNMYAGIIDAFQTVQMVRRFRKIERYNLYISEKKRYGIYPLSMKEIDKLKDENCCIMLNMKMRSYNMLSERAKILIKTVIIINNASKANYREIVFSLLGKQGIKPIEAEEIDEEDLVTNNKSKKEMESDVYVEHDDKDIEIEANKIVAKMPKDIRLHIKEFRTSGLVHENMVNASLVALFILTVVCGVNLNNFDEITAEMDYKIRKSKILIGDLRNRNDKLLRKIQERFYSSTTDMTKVKVVDLYHQLKKSSKNDRVKGGKTFDSRRTIDFYDRLGYYSLNGFKCSEPKARKLNVNGRRKVQCLGITANVIWTANCNIEEI